MTELQSTQSVHVLLAVQANRAGMAVRAKRRWRPSRQLDTPTLGCGYSRLFVDYLSTRHIRSGYPEPVGAAQCCGGLAQARVGGGLSHR